MISRLALCAAVVTGLVVTQPVGAQSSDPSMDPVAEAHLKKAQRMFQEERYESAIAELKAGYRIDPHPDFLYAQGQAQRESGDCSAAVETYRRFLEHEPPAEEARLAKLNIERCEARLAEEGTDGHRPLRTPEAEQAEGRGQPPSGNDDASGPRAEDGNVRQLPTSRRETPEAEPADGEAPPSPSTTGAEAAADAAATQQPGTIPTGASQRAGTETDRTPWYTDWIGNTLAGAGILALGGSALTFFYGDSRAQDANEAQTYGGYRQAAGDARRLRIVGITTAAVAGALLVGGIVRYLRRDARKEPAGDAPHGDSLSRWDEQ